MTEMTDNSTVTRRQIISNVVLLVVGVVLVAVLAWDALQSPTGETRGALQLSLARNAFLTTLPRESRTAWQGYFADTGGRAAHLRSITGGGIDARILGVSVDMRGLIWSPAQQAGHYIRSGRPGEDTNIVIVGHSGSGLVFESLVEVVEGDVFTVTTTDNQVHRYRVVSRELLPVADADATRLRSYVDAVMPTSSEQLTLITCFPPDDYSQRLIVRAVPEAS